jgi:UDP-glucose 4-epimerase
MSKFVVTGGAGFIGSHLAELLVGRGDEVRVIDNLSTGKRENLRGIAAKIEFVEGDVGNGELLRSLLRGVDCVFHQAALASVPLSIEDPLATHQACVTTTVNLLHEARRAGVKRVVLASSSSVYGNQSWVANREADASDPLSPYAAAKSAAESYCRAFWHSFGLETVCLRYFNVFGPRQDPAGPYSAVIPKFISLLGQGKRPVIFGDGTQSRDFTFVRDVVRANLLAATVAGIGGRVFNIATGHRYSLLTLARLLNEIMDRDLPPIFEAARTGDVKDSMADVTAAQRELGFFPEVEFETGLRETHDWYAREGNFSGR